MLYVSIQLGAPNKLYITFESIKSKCIKLIHYNLFIGRDLVEGESCPIGGTIAIICSCLLCSFICYCVHLYCLLRYIIVGNHSLSQANPSLFCCKEQKQHNNFPALFQNSKTQKKMQQHKKQKTAISLKQEITLSTMGCLSSKEGGGGSSSSSAEEAPKEYSWDKDRAKINPQDYIISKQVGQVIVKEPGYVLVQ